MIARTAYQLFIEALDVMNAALNVNRKSPVLRSLLATCDTVLAGVDLVVVIQSRRFESPLDCFTIRLKDGNFVLVARGISRAKVDWYVSEDYLREIADHPRRYIEEPWKLDLEWLRDRAVTVCATVDRGPNASGSANDESPRQAPVGAHDLDDRVVVVCSLR